MSINEIITSALGLPMEERALITDILTQSLNPSNNEIEQNWITEINNRVELLEKGELEIISYKEFFDEN
ncbi:MAG: addiction module protein [Arcobacteraceae bacterium]|jgi:hypothetical protein|nr:addiction module protein [Arcobacteraceae bacterium]